MIILQESGSAQNIDFIPRSFVSGGSYVVTIDDEQTGKNIHNATTTSITEVLYFNRYNATFTTKQDNFYVLTIKSSSDVIFKDRIFCTNQTDYSINNGEYQQTESNNDFIFA